MTSVVSPAGTINISTLRMWLCMGIISTWIGYGGCVARCMKKYMSDGVDEAFVWERTVWSDMNDGFEYGMRRCSGHLDYYENFVENSLKSFTPFSLTVTFYLLQYEKCKSFPTVLNDRDNTTRWVSCLRNSDYAMYICNLSEKINEIALRGSSSCEIESANLFDTRRVTKLRNLLLQGEG